MLQAFFQDVDAHIKYLQEEIDGLKQRAVFLEEEFELDT